MKRYFNFALILFVALLCALPISSSARAQTSAVTTGELVTGRIEPVPEGALVVSVKPISVNGQGGEAQLSGPPGFLVALSGDASISGGQIVRGKGASFLPTGSTYTLKTSADSPATFLFIGLGKSGDVEDPLYETKPLPWGPGQGKAYDVSINREKFSGGGATPWHYHTGPAFGILEGGDWENRQATGITERIQMPGYYLQPAGPIHQLAQIGDGGYTYIVQFYPPGQSKTGGGPGVGASTPTVLVAVETPIAAAAGRNLLVPDNSVNLQSATATMPAVGPSITPDPNAPVHNSEDPVADRNMMAGYWAGGIVISLLLLGALIWLLRAQRLR